MLPGHQPYIIYQQRRLHLQVEASFAPGTKASTPALSRRIPLGCDASPATTAALGFYLAGGTDQSAPYHQPDEGDGMWGPIYGPRLLRRRGTVAGFYPGGRRG